MKTRAAGRLAWSTWLLVLAFVVVFNVYSATQPGSDQTGDLANTVAYMAWVIAFSTVGALVAAKRPGNAIGWLLLGSALSFTLAGFGLTLPGSTGGGRFSPVVLGQWAGAWMWGVGLGLAVLSLLVFPDGRPPSRRWRPVLWLAVVGLVGFVVGMGFGTRFIGGTHIRNPFAIGGAVGHVLGGLQGGFGLVAISGVLALVSIVVRFRRARGAEREQIKWLVYAVAAVGLGLLAQVPLSAVIKSPQALSDAENAISSGTIALVPMAIGVAILRHRLYDIDRIINRSLVYVLLSVVLGGVYAGLAVGLGSLTGQSNSFVIAGSTLAVAALFGPARRRIQRFIDRRFYRRRYDATRTLESFTSRLREEVDLDDLQLHLLGVVRDTMQPAQASLWLRTEKGQP
ncbi:MAG: hypothetical protein M3Q23_13485 [Actinomycetota bacterium]|nr:hypothetical protein [Actinomycetota bacterium]